MSLLGLNIQPQKLEVVEEWLRGCSHFYNVPICSCSPEDCVHFSARGRCTVPGPVFTMDMVREGKQGEPHHRNSHSLLARAAFGVLWSQCADPFLYCGEDWWGGAEGGVLSPPRPPPSDRGLRAATMIVPERNLPELPAIFPHESFFISFTHKFKPFLSFKSLLCCLTSLPWFSPPPVLLLL